MRKIMANVTSDVRTRQFSIQFKIMILYLLCVKWAIQANQIVADEIEHHVKVPLVREKHAVVRTDDEFILRATGFSKDDSKVIRFKATFSSDYCDDNATDLFVQAVETSLEQYSYHLMESNSMESKPNMDLLISLEHFNFGNKTTAYVCAKWRNDMKFEHMGANSKFER